MNHQFLVVWDNQGLEYLVDVTADEQRRIWSGLKEGSACETAVPNLNHVLLRARHNPQRHYEIYVVEAVEGITEEDLRDMFDANPQQAADTVRDHGHCVYSDRIDQEQVRIR